jgi:ABC-2 type transport system permease protein
VSDIRTIATHPPAHRAGGWSGRIVGDSLTLAARTTRLSMRRPDALLTAVLMPVMLMVLFGNLFGGAIHTGVNYVSYLVPGVVLTCVLLGSSTTAVSVNDDMTHGIIDRFRSLDVGGPAFLAGHVAASVARSAASTVLVFAVAFPMGFHAEAGPMEWLAMAGVVLLLILAVCWLSAVGGLIVSSPDAASSLTFFMMLVAFISSAFVRCRPCRRGFALSQSISPRPRSSTPSGPCCSTNPSARTPGWRWPGAAASCWPASCSPACSFSAERHDLPAELHDK